MDRSNNKILAKREYMLTAPIMKLLIKLSIPTILGMLITVIYNITDTFFIGLLGNPMMIAAIGVSFTITSIIQATGFLIGYGSGNYMSKKIGEEDLDEAEETSTLAIALSILIGVIILLFVFLFTERLSVLLIGRSSSGILEYTIEYLKIVALGAPFTIFSICAYNQLRLCGSPTEGMIGMLTGMLANIILDPLFIFYLGMGFQGAAYATVAGQILGSIILLFFLKSNLNIRLLNVKFNAERIKHIFIGGTPNFSRQSLTSISLILLNRISINYGAALVAAMTVSTKIITAIILIVIGWEQAFQPVCAMNFGAKKYERIKKAFIYSLGVGTVYLILSTVAIVTFADRCIEIFLYDRKVIDIGATILKYQSLSLPFVGFYALISMFMQNIGRYGWSLFIAACRQGIIYIPALLILSNSIGEFGVIVAQPLSDVISFLIALNILIQFLSKEKYKN